MDAERGTPSEGREEMEEMLDAESDAQEMEPETEEEMPSRDARVEAKTHRDS
jgi:hypothetical protein